MGNGRGLNVVEFIHDLTARGETLELVGDQLQYRARMGSSQQHTIDTIRRHKPELAAWLRERSALQVSSPLSHGQQGVWMACRLAPDTPIYNLFTIARLRDDVDLITLHRAAQLLLDRHPVLRTIYPLNESTALPIQRVQSEQAVDFTVVDGESWTPNESDQWMEQAADRPFDLIHGPVMRMVVLRTLPVAGQPVRILHWTIHHIASDFFTQEILLEGLEACYRSIHQELRRETSAANLTYLDFVRWESDVIQEQEEKLTSFWRTQIGDKPPTLNLPDDVAAARPGAPGGEYQAKTYDFYFDPEQAVRLRAFARAQQTTLFALFLTAYEILLARYSGQDDFLVTTPTSVRNLSAWENTAGYLINPLLIRADLAGNPSVHDLLKRVQATVAAALEHQMYPYGAVLRMLQTVVSPVQPGKLAAGFILNTARKPASAPTLFAGILAAGQRGAAEDFSLSVFDMAQNLSGQVTYNAARFSPALIERGIGHFKNLLRYITVDANQPVQHVPMLGDEERHEMPFTWNDTAADYPRDKTIHELFEEQAERTPNAPALIYGPHSLTYAELNTRANQLAHHLRAQGVGSETPVGICVERSFDMLAGLLGIFKAGGAYVPLDPSYPPERLAFMLQDADVGALLTQSHLLDGLPSKTAAVICLDGDSPEIRAQSPDNPRNQVQSQNLAYIIYTSGSMGQPKGVQGLHQAAVNRFSWMWRTIPFASHEVCCQKTALSFVDSVWEIFGPLLRGVASVIIPDRVVKDPSALVATLGEHEIARIVLVPSLLRAMLESEPRLQDRLPRLTHWICSGEALGVDLVQRFHAQMLNARLLNLYGSSEVAADATWYDTSAFERGRSIPIGRPIANIQCYILDAAQQLVPPGVQGELYIGGDGLARGYHRRPDLTAERFVPNPFGPGRLYKTGDLARWLPTPNAAVPPDKVCPNIEFLGRADHQIKLRGFRIELAEIEAALRQHPAVREAIVVVNDDAAEERRLVAYLVLDKDIQELGEPTDARVTSLREHLSRKLPHYMIPSAFVPLDALPLTPNGKVDRRALTSVGVVPVVLDDHFESPKTATEEVVAAIWAEILGVTQVGRHDHFFAMGGHSLSATRVATAIQQRLQTDLPLRAIFDNPTLADLADQIESEQLAVRMQDLSPGPSKDEVELVL